MDVAGRTLNVAREVLNVDEWGQVTIDLVDEVTIDLERASAR